MGEVINLDQYRKKRVRKSGLTATDPDHPRHPTKEGGAEGRIGLPAPPTRDKSEDEPA